MNSVRENRMMKGRDQVMKHFPNGLLVATIMAACLPPLLLIPMIYRLPGAQLFKDAFEACMWLSPAVGALALVAILHRVWTGAASFRVRRTSITAALACLDLLTPPFFYVLLAAIAGR